MVHCTGSRETNNTDINPNNPHYKLKSKRKSGLPISIHLVNPVYWLLPYLKDVPKCCHNACVFDQDNVTEDTDVVLVMGFHLKEWQRPTQRWPGQLYVLMDTEPPANLPSALWNATSNWRYAFNLTAHYRVDADIFLPYQFIKSVSLVKQQNYLELAKGKNKTVLWIVSHCKTQSRRERYVSEMQKYIDVDIFGRCSNISICRGTNVNIPVVRGGANYAQSIPGGTFIDANNFESPKDLAIYLRNLSADLDGYSTFLRNKDQYQFVKTPNVYCSVCNKIRDEIVKPKIYDVKAWLEEQCHGPKPFEILK
ncbi:alpha-(1,3)-fucosyltransferase C-like [Physella acuta]|uniref:alpha-(1,3)-fucosyltransferase C-like n=1 Tax=Physella acuta TaxID=109671 RepID=UPI0027DC896D|nr:alpha-(1,3)-fucosyltransferase C-like [Physella acuta]